MQDERGHQHHHPRGPVFEFGYAVSMLFGRGALARTVAEQAALTTSDFVIDVGCGPGTAVRRARKEGAARTVGIDPSHEMLRLAGLITTLRRVKCAWFVQGSAERLPFGSDSATVVWAVQSVHHWADRSRGLQEVLRVLLPEGRLVLLERSVAPGARGLAAHGLSEQEVNDLALLLTRHGFAGVAQRRTPLGRRNFVVITASAPPI
jgi:ubiquinone/menaquinone biosynthesis C-methylase UbiE